MFNNKKDPLVDSVKTVMEANYKRRDAESRVNEAFGVTSKRGLPHELHADYDAALQKATEVALKEGVEALNEGKWNYPKELTKTKETSDMGTTNAARNREDRKKIRKAAKAKAHKALMSGLKEEEVEHPDSEPKKWTKFKIGEKPSRPDWVSEESSPQIKESFEQFLRSKFLKD